MDSRIGWLQQQGIIGNYDIGGVSPHGSDHSGSTLSRDDGAPQPRNRGAVRMRTMIDDQQRQARFAPISGTRTNNYGNPANFGGPDASISRRHLDQGPTTRKWAPGTSVKKRRTVLDKPLHASVSRVRATSAHEYFPDTSYSYPARRG